MIFVGIDLICWVYRIYGIVYLFLILISVILEYINCVFDVI